MEMDTARNITTARQLLEAGDIGPCELVGGRLRVMSPAGGRHGRIAARITGRLDPFVESTNCGAVLAAETGFLIASEPDTVRAPDVAFVGADRVHLIPERGFVKGYPDLAVEVLSPDDRRADIDEKAADWLAAGTRIVWVVDPGARTITVHRAGVAPRIVGAGGTVTGEDVLPGFVLPVDVPFRV